jgi:hypothetical protein
MNQFRAECIQEQTQLRLARHEQRIARQQETTAEAECRLVQEDRDEILQHEQQRSILALRVQDDLT